MAGFLGGVHHLTDKALGTLDALIAMPDAAGSKIDLVVSHLHGA
jgi:hypothetical protein